MNMRRFIRDGGMYPTALVVVADTLDVLNENETLNIKLAEEFFRDALNIKGSFEATSDFSDGNIALGVKFADVHGHGGELA